MSSSFGDDSAVAHIILCCVAGKGVSSMLKPSCGYAMVGMHVNFLVHGVLGYMMAYDSYRYYRRLATDSLFSLRSDSTNSPLREAYRLSLNATKCLAVPCLMADFYRQNENVSNIYLLSGIIPFAMTFMTRCSCEKIITCSLAVNVVSLGLEALHHGNDWAFYTTGAAVIAYFVARDNDMVQYPLSLALLEYCTYQLIGLGFTCAKT